MQNERNDREEPNAAHCVYYDNNCYVGNDMRKEKFTKGPWDTRLSRSHTHHVSGDNEYVSICSMSAWLWSDPREESIANAHLIAAAPELYETLTQLIDDLSNTVEEGLFEHSETVIRCRLALAKARGEI